MYGFRHLRHSFILFISQPFRTQWFIEVVYIIYSWLYKLVRIFQLDSLTPFGRFSRFIHSRFELDSVTIWCMKINCDRAGKAIDWFIIRPVIVIHEPTNHGILQKYYQPFSASRIQLFPTTFLYFVLPINQSSLSQASILISGPEEKTCTENKMSHAILNENTMNF